MYKIMGKELFKDFEIESLNAIAKIIKDNDLGKVKIKNGDFEVCVEAKTCPPPTMVSTAAPAVAVTTSAENNKEAAENTPAPSGNVCKSPIVGTFYAASAPDKEPFVTVGKEVHKGDVIYIIESMKVMSEVTSEFDGKVKEICVNNGDAVEFGQPIMIIE